MKHHAAREFHDSGQIRPALARCLRGRRHEARMTDGACSTGRHRFQVMLGPAADGGVEARTPVGVAGRTFLIDQHQQTIAVAIDAHLDQVLDMARGLALLPVLLARARPVGDPAGCQGPGAPRPRSSRPSSAPRLYRAVGRWRGSARRRCKQALPDRTDRAAGSRFCLWTSLHLYPGAGSFPRTFAALCTQQIGRRPCRQ